MSAVVNVNGRITDARDAMVPVLDRGFLYGEGVYEVVRSYNRRLFLFDRHIRRLRQSAGMIQLEVPLTDAEFDARVAETTAALDAASGEHPARELYVRILLTRGVGDLSYDPAACGAPTWVVIVKALAPHPESLFDDGVKVVFAPILRNHPRSVNPLIKSNNLLNNALAAQHAFRAGAFEGLMRNYRGEVTECSRSNLFVVKNGVVQTPPLEAGLLAGITRAFTFEIGAEIGLSVQEAVLVDDDLFGADEVFLTGTTTEIAPVVRIDNRTIGTGWPGPISRRLLERYREKARAPAEVL